MTDNEKLARWQGCKFVYDSSEGTVFTPPNRPKAAWQPISRLPDYLTDDTAAMSLLDTLVEKEYYPELFYCLGHKWNCTISDDGDLVVQGRGATRREAIVAACLEVARKEARPSIAASKVEKL